MVEQVDGKEGEREGEEREGRGQGTNLIVKCMGHPLFRSPTPTLFNTSESVWSPFRDLLHMSLNTCIYLLPDTLAPLRDRLGTHSDYQGWTSREMLVLPEKQPGDGASLATTALAWGNLRGRSRVKPSSGNAVSLTSVFCSLCWGSRGSPNAAPHLPCVRSKPRSPGTTGEYQVHVPVRCCLLQSCGPPRPELLET